MILSTDQIDFSYPQLEVLKSVTFSVKEGECLAILGTNGAGKSTLLKCLNRILIPKSGAVYLNGQDTASFESNSLARSIGYVAQKQKNTRTTVFDAILLGRKPYIKWDAGQKDIDIVEDIVSTLDLKDYGMRYTDELSGGELQKVMIARALAQQPRILLMDEPTSNLDLKNQLDVISIIRGIVEKQKISAVVTMHDLNLALRFADKFLFLKEGRLFAFGGAEVMTEKIIKEVFDVDVIFKEHNGIPIVVLL